MRHALTIINDVRGQIAETPERLGEARARRDVVRAAGESFPGALRAPTIRAILREEDEPTSRHSQLVHSPQRPSDLED